MEILLFSITEFLVIMSIVALVGSGCFLSVAVSSCGLLFGSLSRFVRRKQWADAVSLASKEPQTLGRKIAKCVLVAGLASLIIIIAATLLIDRYYFEPFMRWTAGQVGKWRDISVDFDQVSGSLWKGRLAFGNFSATRHGHPINDFSVSAKAIEMQLSEDTLSRGRGIYFDIISVDTVRGRWEQKYKKAANTTRAKRKFTIHELRVHDVRLEYVNALEETPLTAQIHIEDIDVVGLRSDYLWFNLLFTNQMKGSVNDTSFEIGLKAEADEGFLGFKSLWQCEKMPIGLLAAFFDQPFNWFDQGWVDIKVVNSVFLDAPNKVFGGLPIGVEMDWSLVFKDHHAKVPANAPLTTKMAAGPLLAYINSRPELPISYKLRLSDDNSQFATSAELDQTVKYANENGLMKAFMEAGR
jgi:hypothetical protein